MESNDSPEITDRGDTSDIPGYNKTYTNVKHKIFEELVPSVSLC